MRLYVSCEGKTISLPLTRVSASISRPDWIEEVIPHLEDEHAAELDHWIGEPYTWDAIAYQYTDGDAVSGAYMAADGRDCA